jgi:preprotein translocase subunit SecE
MVLNLLFLRCGNDTPSGSRGSQYIDLFGASRCLGEGRMATRTTSKGGEKRGRFSGLQSLVRDTSSEIRKVTWPDKQTTRSLTIVVIAMAVTLGIMLGGIDAGLVRLWEAIPSF